MDNIVAVILTDAGRNPYLTMPEAELRAIYAGLDKAIDAAIEAHLGIETDEEDEAQRRRIRRLELMQDLICAALGTTRYAI